MENLQDVLNKEELSQVRTVMYHITKDASMESFIEYLKECGATEEAWDKFKDWLRDNGVETYI